MTLSSLRGACPSARVSLVSACLRPVSKSAVQLRIRQTCPASAHTPLTFLWTASCHSPSPGSTNTSRRPVTVSKLRRPAPVFATMAGRSTSLQQQQVRSHAGHSHSHGAADNLYLLSQNKNDAGVRITRIGLWVNLGMAISKFIGGYVFHSKALTADAIHSLTDLVSDVMTLATVSLAMKPPSNLFPAGYGKVESLGSLGVSGILLVGGALMGWAAIMQLVAMFLPEVAGVLDGIGLTSIGHSHGHDHADLGPDLNAAWLAAGSIAIKEWLYRATMKVAKERRSNVLASNAYHHRVDSLTALVALIMIGGTHVVSNAAWMDPVGGLIISLMVIQAGIGNTKGAIMELADKGIEDDMKHKIHKAIEATWGPAAATDNTPSKSNGAVSAVKQRKGAENLPSGDDKMLSLPPRVASEVKIRQVQGIKAGQTYRVEIELGVPSSWTVAQTKAVEDAVRDSVGRKVRGVKRVRIRFVPQNIVAGDGEEQDFMDEFIPADISPRSSPEPDSDDEHGHSHHTHKH